MTLAHRSPARALATLALGVLAACNASSPPAKPLPAPAGLTLTSPVQGALVATWEPVPKATGYAVYAGPAGGPLVRTEVVGASWSRADLAPGEPCDVAVAALDGAREGLRSAPVRRAPRAAAVISIASPSSTRVSLAWSAASDGSYVLYRSTATPVDPAAATAIPVSATVFVDDTVAPGTTYHYAVAGTAGGLTSFPGPEVTVAVPYPQPSVAEPAGVPGVTGFGQTIPAGHGLEVFPGQANFWDLDRDLSLASGGFSGPFAGALLLYVGALTPGAATLQSLEADVLTQPRVAAFPYDQTHGELTFLAPLFGSLDGVRTAELSDGVDLGLAPISGTRSLFLNGTGKSVAQQVIPVAGLSAPVVLSWSHVFEPSPGAFPGAPPPTFTVRFRDLAGAPLGAPVHVATGSEQLLGVGGSPGLSVEVGPWPGHDAVVLSFELSGPTPTYAEIDDVVLSGGAAVTDGGFEAGTIAAGTAAWTAPSPAEPQNIQSAARELCVGDPANACAAKLLVRRTFFAAPASPWARITDVFENSGASPVTADAVYLTLLAAGASEELHVVQGGGAVIGSDPSALGTRNFGIVFGAGEPYFASATPEAVALGAPDGSGRLFVVHRLTVPAGGRVAIVQFVVLDGAGRAGGASTALVEAEAIAILVGYGSSLDVSYRDWLPAGVEAAVGNL